MTDTWGLLSFGVGMSAFRLGRLGAMGLCSKLGMAWGSRLTSALFGLAAESTAMSATHRVGNYFSDHRSPDLWQGFGREVLATGLNMALFRGMGWMTEGRSLLLQQGGMLAGNVLGDLAGQKLGWAPSKSVQALFTDALVAMVYFQANGFFAQQLWGSRFMAMQHRLDQWAEQLAPGYVAEKFWLGAKQLAGPDWVAMSASEEGGGGGKLGKLIKFPSSPPAPPVKQGPPRALLLDQAKSYTEEGKANLDYIRACLDEILEHAEMYARHRMLNRLAKSTAEEWSENIKAVAGLLMDFLEEGAMIHSSLEELAIIAKQLPHTESDHFQKVFERYRDLAKAKKELPSKVRSLVTFLPRQRPAEIFAQRLDLNRWVRRILHQDTDYGDDTQPWGDMKSIAYEGVKGMLFGIGAKEIFRLPSGDPACLDPVSSRRSDWEKVHELLNQLVIDGHFDRFREHLLLTSEARPGAFPMLRFHLNKELPLQGWFGLALPLMVARYGANYDQIRAQSLALEASLPESFRTPSALVLWVLTQAVNQKGFPGEWFKNLPQAIKKMPGLEEMVEKVLNLTSSQEISWHEKLGDSFSSLGERAVVPYSLALFLHAYDHPEKVLGLAAASPESMREEILTLTGAMLGAYHGPGFFNRGLLENLAGRWDLPQQLVWKDPRVNIAIIMAELPSLWLPETEGTKVRVLDGPGRVVKAQPARGNFVSRLDVIFQELNGELSTLLQSSTSQIRRAQATGIPTPHWLLELNKINYVVGIFDQFQNNLRDFIKNSAGVPNLGPKEKSKITQSVREIILQRVESTLKQLKEMEILWEDAQSRKGEIRLSVQQISRMNRLLNGIRDSFEIFSVVVETDVATPKSFTWEDLHKIHEVGLMVSPFRPWAIEGARRWEEQAPWGHAMALAHEFSGRPIKSISFDEILQTFYKNIDWRPKVGSSKNPLEDNIEFKVLATVLTPAYLEIFRSDPRRAYRDLEGIDIEPDPQKLEAWRGFTYLILRLLQGSPPDLFLARELRDALYHPSKSYAVSPLGLKMQELIHHLDSGTEDYTAIMDAWHRSLLPVDQVAVAFSKAQRGAPRRLRPIHQPQVAQLLAMLLEASWVGSGLKKDR